ncbi:MAG: flagellar hook-associated protein FlgK [Pseudomonadota bacterium]
MSISQALGAAVSGLNVASRRAAVVSNNVSNALTPGYARREVSSAEKVVAGVGIGVEVASIDRAGNAALTAARRAAEADSTRDTIVADVQSQLSILLGGPEDQFSFFGTIDSFEQSLSDLREAPESATQQQNSVVAAQQIVRVFNQTGAENDRIRQQADNQITRIVSQLNETIDQINTLNDEISAAGFANRDTSALEDQRQRLIDDVSKAIPVKEVPLGDGKLGLITNEGVFVLSNKPELLEFTPSIVVGPLDTLANGGVSGLSINGVDITPGSDAALAVQGGELAAQFIVRDEITVEFGAQLDALAADLIERFSDPLNDPTLTGGAPGLFTDNGAALASPFDAGLSRRIAVNDAVVAENGGDAWRLRDGIGAAAQGVTGNSAIVSSMLDGLREPRTINAAGFAAQASSVDAAAEFTSLRAGASLNADTRASTSSARSAGLIEDELATTAVDTDAELQKLLVIEQSYAANARVISVVDSLLQRLLEI